MKIGLFTIESYGELKTKTSVEDFIRSIGMILAAVSEDFSFDYRRFAFYAAVITFTLPLTIFWQNDTIYKTLKKKLDIYFHNWEFELTLTIHEKGD